MDLGDHRLRAVARCAWSRRRPRPSSSRHSSAPSITSLDLLGQVVAALNARPAPSIDDDPDRGSSAAASASRDRARRRARADQGVELLRPIEDEPDAPGRSARTQDGGSSGHRPASPRTTSASTATAPSAVGDDRVEVDRAGCPDASTPSRPTATMIGRRWRPGRPAARPRAPSSSGAATELVEHRRRVRPAERREPDRDVVEDLGQDAPEADDDRRTEQGVAAQRRR